MDFVVRGLMSVLQRHTRAPIGGDTYIYNRAISFEHFQVYVHGLRVLPRVDDSSGRGLLSVAAVLGRMSPGLKF